MALTKRDVRNAAATVGQYREKTIDIDLDNSYPNAGGGAGGYPLAPELFGFKKLFGVSVVGMTDTSVTTNLFAFNVVTAKLVVYVASTGVEVANGVDVSGQKLRLKGVGR